jgi:hypothetical protein
MVFGPGERVQIVKRQIERGGVDALWRVASPVNKSRNVVTNESYTLTNTITLYGRTSIIGETVDWSLPDTHVNTGTVVVKSDDLLTTYTENTDYSANYTTAVITRIGTGAIFPGSTIKISYHWEEPMVLLRSGNARPENDSAGINVIYDRGTTIKGLLHIPKYESPLMKVGFFELGDAIFTTTTLYKVKARGQGNYDYMTRDILTIDDGTGPQIWRVLSKPETIQLQNEFLAHKIAIRKLKEDEVIHSSNLW